MLTDASGKTVNITSYLIDPQCVLLVDVLTVVSECVCVCVCGCVYVYMCVCIYVSVCGVCDSFH